MIALQKSFLIIFFRFSAFTIVKLQTVVLKELSRTKTDENLRVQKVRGKNAHHWTTTIFIRAQICSFCKTKIFTTRWKTFEHHFRNFLMVLRHNNWNKKRVMLKNRKSLRALPANTMQNQTWVFYRKYPSSYMTKHTISVLITMLNQQSACAKDCELLEMIC